MTARRDDAEEIRRRLDDQIEAVLDRYFPSWIKRGGKAYLTPKNAKQLGSFQVNLEGSRRGQWYRFSQRIGGGSVELLSYALTNGVEAYGIAFREARAFLGMSPDRGADDEELRNRRRSEREKAERKRRQQDEQEKRRRARRAETAAEVWAECTPIAGTLAEDYLVGRGIPAPPDGWPDVVGFHKGLEWELGAEFDDGRKVKDGQVFPCLVARVDDAVGDLIAVWRIFLDPLTAGKADVPNPKLGLGPAKGGAVRLFGVARKIGASEGLESAFGAWWLTGRKFPVWATLSTSGMVNFEVPAEVEDLAIFPDGDRPIRRDPRTRDFVPTKIGAGIKAARGLHERVSRAITATIEPEPPAGSDYLDLWVKVSGLEVA